jgi:hypothetical protein
MVPRTALIASNLVLGLSAAFSGINGSFGANSDWDTLQVAIESVGTNPTLTPAARCAGPTPSAAAAAYACARMAPPQ